MLSLIPEPFRLYAEIAIVVAGAAAAAGAAGWVVHHERNIGRAEINAVRDKENLQRQAVALKAQQDAATETARRLAAQQKADHDHETQLAAARADAAATASAAARLRQRIAQLASGSGPAPDHPAAAGVSTPAAGLGDVAGQCVAAYSELAEAARRGYLAGNDAAARYDALTAPP
jgi:hypothetical protein